MRRINQIKLPKTYNFLDMPIVDVMSKPQQSWNKLLKDVNRKSKTASHKIAVDWTKYNNNDYLFTHTSIVASVATEDNNYHIIDPCDELVNANGNAWTNEVLPHCFKTFIGGENYLEHVQVKELSKGKILDAVLRPVTYIGKNNKKAKIFYCDILIATNRIHEAIVSRVMDGTLTTLSMGAIADYTQCSYCGKIISDEMDNCDHLEHRLGQYVTNYTTGKKHFVAELCGAINPKTNSFIEDSCYFIEASWVEQPAFKGAVLNHIVSEVNPNEFDQNQLNSKMAFLFDDVSKLAHLKVANKQSSIAIQLALQEIRKQRYNGIIEKIIT